MPDTIALPSLDSPFLAALDSAHRHLAESNGLALRYPRDVSPFAALREPTDEAFADLAGLVEPGGVAALVTRDVLTIPPSWEIVLQRQIDQKVYAGGALPMPEGAPPGLGDADVPDMVALAELTKPGPFLERTLRMGRYYGLRSPKGQLMAMAGERLTSDQFTEISAVCTHPAFVGRGLGRQLVTFVLAQLLSEGRFPVLHVKTENEGAKGLYAKLGFRANGAVSFVVMKRR